MTPSRKDKDLAFFDWSWIALFICLIDLALCFQLPKMDFKPGTEIRYTPFPRSKYPEGSTPEEITKHSMDSTYQLEQLLAAFQRYFVMQFVG